MEQVCIPVLCALTQRVLCRYCVNTTLLCTSNADANSLASLDAQFRAHLSTLFANTPAITLEGERTFDIVVKTTGVSIDTHWMHANGSQTTTLNACRVLPLKDRDENADTVHLESWIELPTTNS